MAGTQRRDGPGVGVQQHWLFVEANYRNPRR
jgi:hypothetical protein